MNFNYLAVDGNQGDLRTRRIFYCLQLLLTLVSEQSNVGQTRKLIGRKGVWCGC